MKKNEKKSKIGAKLYFVGSLALAAGAVIVMPKVVAYLSDKFYSLKSSDLQKDDDDDWGPEIVKRNKTAKKEFSETEGATDGKL